MARRHSLLYLHCLLKFKTEEFTIAGEAENKSKLKIPNSKFGWQLPAAIVFFFVFPLMGACCAQIKGFTLGCRELVLVRPNVKPFV